MSVLGSDVANNAVRFAAWLGRADDDKLCDVELIKRSPEGGKAEQERLAAIARTPLVKALPEAMLNAWGVGIIKFPDSVKERVGAAVAEVLSAHASKPLVEALVKAAQDSRTSEDMLTAEWRASFSLRAASVLSAHWPQGDIHAASALGEPSK